VDGGGRVPEEVMRQLELPMPDDVLEQFILDHGVNEEFHEQYGELNLHAIPWSLAPMTAREFLSVSIFENFLDWPESVAKRARAVPREGWDNVSLADDAKEHWKTHGTWRRSPALETRLIFGLTATSSSCAPDRTSNSCFPTWCSHDSRSSVTPSRNKSRLVKFCRRRRHSGALAIAS
jgi:hypothetical protein